MTSTKDIYWLAGILEGEGCFTIMPHGQPRIQLRMTDKDVIERAACILGNLTVHVVHPKLRRQPIYGCAVAGRNAIAWMMTIYTIMGERRKQRIRESLAAWQGRRRWTRRTDKKLPAHLTVPDQTTSAA